MEAFREAPLHRARGVYYITYSGQSTVNAVKSLVSAGSPITFTIDAGQYSRGFSDGNYILTASEYSSMSLNHAQTIVGYDDSISDDLEIGAFKVVNSWGSGWADRGYYWLTYDAFKEIGSIGLLFLTYMADIPQYTPSLLAVWHFNQAPSRNANLQLGIGSFTSPVQSKSPYFEEDSAHRFPTFMALDISEFKSIYDGGVRNFFMSLGWATSSGTISDFKIELYEGSYVPGVATQVSRQSFDVPKTSPGYVTNFLTYYFPISYFEAVESPGYVFDSSSYVKWVGVNHHSYSGGDSIQSGDVGDSYSSRIEANIVGPAIFTFSWKVSSELSHDYLTLTIDGSIYATISGEVDWKTEQVSLDAGPHDLIWAYSKDSSNSQGEDCGWIDNFLIDSAPPTTTHTFSGIDGLNGWYKSSVTVTLTASDNGGSGVHYTMYRIDGTIWRIYSLPFTIYTEGTSTIDYYSADKSGNVENVNVETVHIDTVSPETTISFVGSFGLNSWYNSQVHVTLTATDSTSGFQRTVYRIDDGDWQDYSGTFQIFDDGIYSLEYYSEDNAGNAGSIEAAEIKIDKINPLTVASLSGTQGENDWYTSVVGVTLSSFDEMSNVNWTEYRIDGGNWQTYTGPFTVATDGIHSIDYHSQDISGNTEVQRNIHVSIDRTPPALTIEQSDGDAYNVDEVTISWLASDQTSGIDRVETSLDGDVFATRGGSTNSILLTELTDGTHNLIIRVFDLAGLSTEQDIDFIVDTTPPITVLDVAGTIGQNSWYVSATTLTLTANDATIGVDTIYYRVDGGSWQEYMGQFIVASDGLHTINYYSSDGLSNNEQMKIRTVKIDTTAPELEIVTPNGDVSQSQITISWDATDVHSGVDRCDLSIDGDSFESFYTATETTVMLPVGNHVIVVRALDSAGNLAERQFGFNVTKTDGGGGLPVSFNWYIYLAIIVVLIVVAILLLTRKRNDSSKDKKLPPPP